MNAVRKSRFFLLCLFLVSVSNTVAKAAEPIIYLVRHAEKTTEPGPDPDLSPAGQRRAEMLARVLADAEIRTIYVTKWKRTQETAATLARASQLKPEIVDDMKTLADRLQHPIGNVLVVGHSNTLPALLQDLGVGTSIALGENSYDDLFILLPKNRLLHLHYDIE